MNYSSPTLIMLRKIGQKLHILKPLVNMTRSLLNSKYEEKFDEYTVSSIPAGSVVWDVGANVGFFTDRFSNAVGDKGSVVAFDPSPNCISVLNEKFSENKNVIIEAFGLADIAGQTDFSLEGGTDPTGGIGAREGHDVSVTVNISTGNSYILEYPKRIPNFIKIDVEGYEYEALMGMTNVLSSKECRGVFIEVHFLQLTKRNMSDAPTKIVQLLKSYGFVVTWIDPSHLAAERVTG
jgi:FkbM family methyltransferase